jgi:hypothetical protein
MSDVKPCNDVVVFIFLGVLYNSELFLIFTLCMVLNKTGSNIKDNIQIGMGSDTVIFTLLRK